MLQYVAACCSVLQCTTHWSLLCTLWCIHQRTATHYNALQHTATHCNTLPRAATHCTTLHHTGPHCATLHHAAPHCTTLHDTATGISEVTVFPLATALSVPLTQVCVGCQKVSCVGIICIFMLVSYVYSHTLRPPNYGEIALWLPTNRLMCHKTRFTQTE